MKSIALSFVVALSACATSPAPKSEIRASAPGAAVAYEKFTLKNGMTVILVPDHRLPVVVINTWFYVGAKDEPPGRSGFAHLFEHLMFMGTKRVPTGQFDRIMEAGGGNNNASTEFDRTNYYSSGPSDLLPTLLWLDADRLEDLGRAMTQEKLDAQRAIVKNERRQTTENVPYGKSELEVVEMLYPEGHPYHYEVIGSHHDLDNASLDDVKEFFANFYVPNNASLVVCGDFEPTAVKPQIESLFGSLPRGGDVPRRDLSVKPLEKEQRFTTLDLVDAPMVRMAWHSPSAYTDGDADMQLIASVLGDDKNGWLYRRLVEEEKLASEVSVAQLSLVAKSEFTIDVRALPGADLDRIETVVKEELAKIGSDGIPDDTLDRVKALKEQQILGAFERLLFKADKMNEYQFFFGEPDGFGRDLARFKAVTPSRCAAFARSVFLAPGRVVVRVLPQEPEREKNERDARPTDFAVKSFAPSKPETFDLKCGAHVDLLPSPELPRVEMRFEFLPPFGKSVGIDPPGKEGAALLLGELAMEGAGKLDGQGLADALAALGARLSPDADRDGIAFDLSAPAENLEAAIDLARQVILAPSEKPDAFERVKTLHLEDLKQELSSPEAVAIRVGDRSLFAAGNPLRESVSGTLASVAAIDLPSLRSLRNEIVRPEYCRIHAAGRVERTKLTTILDRAFGDFAAQGPMRAAASGSTAAYEETPAGLRVFLVDRPGAVQTMVHFALPGPSHSAETKIGADLLSILMGGSFTSRLVQNLREDKGYSYGAHCRNRADHALGSIVVNAAIRADVTGKALEEFLKEFARIRGGDVTDEESRRVRALFRIQNVERLEGLRSQIALLSDLAHFDLQIDALGKDLDEAQTWDKAKLNALAASTFSLDHGVLVLVGDSKVVLPQLEGLGLPAPSVVTP